MLQAPLKACLVLFCFFFAKTVLCMAAVLLRFKMRNLADEYCLNNNKNHHYCFQPVVKRLDQSAASVANELRSITWL